MSMHAGAAAAGFVAFASFCAHADVIDTRGMQPHEQCAYCHELDGNSRQGRFPRLAGQNAAYLAKQLADFRAGRRTNDAGAMSGIAESLGEEEIAPIVRYFATQEPRVMGEARGGEARELYFHGTPHVPACASCHGKLAEAPLIAGQHADYLEKQLRDFKSGTRANDAGSAMRRVAEHLEEWEIRALAAFISGLPVITGSLK